MSTLSSPRIVLQFGGTSTGTAIATAGAESRSVSDGTIAAPAVGSSAGQVNKIYTAVLTVTTSGLTVDLTTLTDPIGDAISFTKVRAIKVTNLSTTTGQNITVGGGASNDFMAALPHTLDASSTGDATWVQNFGADGKTVDGTHKNLLLDSAAGSPSVSVTILGQ